MLERDFRRKLYSGYADSMTRAFELVVAPMVFGLVGFGLDRFFETTPLFTIIAVVIAFAGTGVKLWFGYDLEMRAHDENSAWAKRPVDPGAGAGS